MEFNDIFTSGQGERMVNESVTGDGTDGIRWFENVENVEKNACPAFRFACCSTAGEKSHSFHHVSVTISE